MKNFTLSIFFTILLFPFMSFSQTDIVNGEDADIEDYPYNAALVYGNWGFCGASVINEYWVLTAAHCVQGETTTSFDVKVGSDASYASGGTSYNVAEIIQHPDYNSWTMNNDIALIRTTNPISFNNQVHPVLVVCDQQLDLGVEDPGQMSWVTGWGDTQGTTNSTSLQVVGVPVIAWSNQLDYSANDIDDDMIMAGYVEGGYDSCQGDSGGPMVVLGTDGETFLQVGITSWGYGCADPGAPGVYTRVSYFIDWICTNTDGAVCANEYALCNENAVFGCTDPIAENYNPEAEVNDGSCEYIYGCTDSGAENFNSNATADDGSCEYACDNTVSLYLALDCYGEEISWELINDNGVIVDEVDEGEYPGGSTEESMEEGGSVQEEDICLSVGCYTFTITDSYGDGVGGSEFSCGLDGAPFSITDENGNILFEETSPVFGDCEWGGNDGPCSASYSFCVTASEPVYGCTDPDASNYNPDANTDDESCTYQGCTDGDPETNGGIACNYDSLATEDDGSCEYTSCAGCTDSNYLEYDSSFTIDDGSCETPVLEGCTDLLALNYNEEANTDDGSCEYTEGCTDSNAENYDPEAIEDDGSCIYAWEACDEQQWLETFEDYNPGNIDPQSGDWIGWDNANSNADIVNDFGFGSNQSIFIEDADDLVHVFDGINAGSGEIIFYMYISSSDNAGAYYNILHRYNGAQSIWAHQVMFASAQSGEQCVVDANGYGAASFDAVYDAWVEVRQEIDLDNDYTTLYYNGEEIYSWQFSQDAGGTTQLNVLDAINLYGACAGDGCTSLAYFDNIEMCGNFYDNSDIEDNIILEMNLFPNPNNGSFSIILNENISKFKITIFNVLGQEVYSEKTDNYLINSKKDIHVNLIEGTYIVNLEAKNKSIKMPIIIK